MTNTEGKCCGECKGVMWWAMLVIAVLAVPAVGAVVALTLPFKGMEQIAVFMISCWVSTYLGMRLMNSKK